MTNKIFISYAGDYGKEFASIIKLFIDDITNDMTIAFFAEQSINNADDWMDKIQTAISESKYFFGLLDSFYFTSFYSSMEYGFSLNQSSIAYRFFKIDNDFEVENCPLSNKQVSKSDDLDERAEGITKEILTILEGRIPIINDKIFIEKRVEFTTKIKNTILKIEESAAEELKQAKKHLSKIEELALECIRKNHINLKEDGMKRNYTRMPLRILNYTKENLRWMSSGRIIVELPRFVQDFWSEGIMGFVNSTIWTTNLRGTNGRSISEELIKKQKEAATNRGIIITRIFIYSEADIEDIVTLQSVIQTQISEIPNVQLYLISEEKYATFDYEVEQLSFQKDFMILDKEYAYLTFPSRNNDEIKKSELIDQIDQLQTSNLQAQILNASHKIKQPYSNNNLVNIFPKTSNIDLTEFFFKKNKIVYHLSRNEIAGDCLDASKKRFSKTPKIKPEDRLNDDVGIKLSNEMKTIFGEYGPKKKPNLVVINLPGDQRWSQEKVRTVLGKTVRIRVASKNSMATFGIKFGEVNPFMISELYKSSNLSNYFEELTFIFDKSVLENDNIMMTNAGGLTWGVEFKVSDVVAHFDNVISEEDILES